jgi:hypothetical protein
VTLARCLPRQPSSRRPAGTGRDGATFSVQAAVADWTRTGTRPAWLSDAVLGILEGRNGHLVGLVYLAHFDRPIGDVTNPRGFALHYTGWTLNLPIRLGEHAAGRGARLMQVVTEQGISWQVTRLWIGNRGRERSLKRQGGAARRCPRCRLAAAGAAVPATDQALLDALELGDRPASLLSLLTSPPIPALPMPAPTGPAGVPAQAA